MKKLHIKRRLFRSLLSPAWGLLAWSNRHTLELWARSLRHELQRSRRPDVARLRLLLRSLARVSLDPRLSNAAELRTLSVDGDVVLADADEHWSKRELVRTVLGGVEHVNRVDFVGAANG